jgi:hypothetical protein
VIPTEVVGISGFLRIFSFSWLSVLSLVFRLVSSIKLMKYGRIFWVRYYCRTGDSNLSEW